MTVTIDGTSGITYPAGTIQGTGYGPTFRAYMSSAQTISGSTFTKLQFNTEVFDTASCYDNATNYRFTPNVAGYYQVTAFIYQSTTYQLYVYKNGSADMAGPYIATVGVGVQDLVYMNGTTDYLECYYYGNAITTTNNNAAANMFAAVMVRGA